MSDNEIGTFKCPICGDSEPHYHDTNLQWKRLPVDQRVEGLKQALEILEDYVGVQGVKIKIVAAIDAIMRGQS